MESPCSPAAVAIIERMCPDGRSDEALLAELARTSGPLREALVDELFARHYERVARWCLRFTGDRESAADLAQDVFLKAHRHLSSFKGQSRFSTWLYTIVRHESLNRLQRSSPQIAEDENMDALPAVSEGPDAAVYRQDRAAQVRQLLTSTLDRTECSVFTLHYGDDMPLDAITRLLKLDNASGAKAFIVSARRKLARAAQRLRARGEQP